ncbi:hypothetical protein [Streptomyces chryseus]|uniref:hypothetical protein n=1 Tax=Streptomyces chryseus TaxID=68186 RepID=UPI00110F9CCD|nr:hypothetical protein [Streptomyces chryseus]
MLLNYFTGGDPGAAQELERLQVGGLVDDFAHELAEQIRTTDLPEVHVDMFDNGTQWAADLIDPEAAK